ncbi:hypothetical protein ACWGH2_24800 [Streptomyces sp. NPDC054871]
MRKTLTMLGIGAAAASSLVMVSAPAASAATSKIWAEESVKIRAKTSKTSTALGLFPKGAAGQALMNGQSYKHYYGGKHNFCGSKGTINDNEWVKVTYKGVTGYVASACTLPFKP